MRIVSFCVAILTFISSAQSQYDIEYDRQAENLFLLGMRQYSQKDYHDAYESFEHALSSAPNNHRITASTIMLAKTCYSLKLYTSAIVIADSFLLKFPHSLYIEDAHIIKGMSRYRLNDYVGTYREMVTVLTIAQQSANIRHAKRVLENISEEYLSVDLLQSLISTTDSDTIRSMMFLFMAQRYFSQQERENALSTLESIDPTFLDNAERIKYRQLRARIEDKNDITIAVLLPLQRMRTEQTRDKKIAEEILDGIRFAIDRYEEEQPYDHLDIHLDIRDTERDPNVLVQHFDTLAEHNEVAAIIGPIFSDQVKEAGILAQQLEIPLITPTATDDDIVSVSDYVFQSNTSNAIKAKSMAQFAVNSLGAKTIAVISPSFQPNKTYADSFIAEAGRYGATVLSTKWYERGQTDLRALMRELRVEGARVTPEVVVNLSGKLNYAELTRKLVSIGIPYRTVDSAIAKESSVSLSRFFGDRAIGIADSAALSWNYATLHPDSLQYPVVAFDALFCPIARKTEIGILSSHITLYNLRGQVLGLTEWNDLGELEMNKRYADGVIFGSEKYIERNEHNRSLFALFQAHTGRQFTENMLFGFDAMNVILFALKNSVLSRHELYDALTEISEFSGVRNAISFDRSRVNAHLNILQYKDGVINKVSDFYYTPSKDEDLFEFVE